MKKLVILSIVLFISGIWACSDSAESDKQATVVTAEDEALMAKAKGMFQPLPLNAESSTNPTTVEKVNLGYHLYYDARLSKDGNISCNSCHNLATFGVDNKAVSEGDDGSMGVRNSPTVYNAALHSTQFWDGRAKDVEEQAGMPILNPIEMAMPHEEFVIDRIKGIEMYKQLFAEAFPNESEPINYVNLGKAIGSFERQLLTPGAWDAYLQGDHSALTADEKAGLATFMDVGCNTCHMGNNLGGNMFQKFGVYGNYWELTQSKSIDSGKAALTGNAADLYMFKVPSLRNVAKTGPYFHDGSVKDLNEAIKIMAQAELGKELSDEEVKKIASFMNSLTGNVNEAFTKAPATLGENL